MDFQAIRDGVVTLTEYASATTKPHLQDMTNEMVDTVLGLIDGCRDEDVTFEPLDPVANDPWAGTQEEAHMAWTLGHVIVHITASAEEAAALAAELARGVELHGRSRYEVPWREMTTIEACRRRLEESRRMRLASLDLWPDPPHLDNVTQAWQDGPQVNGVGRFILGLMHSEDHLGQIKDIVAQARAATRSAHIV